MLELRKSTCLFLRGKLRMAVEKRIQVAMLVLHTSAVALD